MIRIPTVEQMNDAKISVFLKNGDSYLEKDITNQPFGEHETAVGFWDNDRTITYIPMSEVKYIQLHIPVPF